LTPHTTAAATEAEIRRHLEQFVPPLGSEPHVWISPVNARENETEKWLDIGPLDAVCQEYPAIADILRQWYPGPNRTTGGILNLTPEIRCWVTLIGDCRHG
jgi:hypothetical protein